MATALSAAAAAAASSSSSSSSSSSRSALSRCASLTDTAFNICDADSLDPNLALVVRQRRSDRDYQRVIQRLRGLPTFDDSVGHIQNTPEAAFTVAGGPSCLIREVLLMPMQHEECPDQVVDLIESARTAQNSSQLELALERLSLALEIWENKSTWKAIIDGMDPIQALTAEREQKHAHEVARAARAAAHDAALAKTQTTLQSTSISDNAAPVQGEVTPTESAQEEKEHELEEDGEGDEDGEDDVDGEGDDVEEEDEDEDDPTLPTSRINRPDEKRESPVASMPTSPTIGEIPAQPFVSSPAASPSAAQSHSPSSSDAPLSNVSSETELEFALFIWNAIGSVYQSQADDRKALLSFWRAKQAHDGYVAKKQAEEKARADAERAAAAAAKGADDDEDSESEQDIEPTPATNEKNVDKNAPARRKLMDPNRTGQLSHEPIIPIQPYLWCTTANAITYSNIGCSLYHLREYDLALRSFHVSAQIRFACLQPMDDEYVDVGTSLNNMGVCLSQLKRMDESYAYLLSAEQVMKTRLDAIHPRINAIRNNLEKIKPRRNQIDLNALTSVFRINGAPKRLEDLPKPKPKAAKKGVPSSLTSPSASSASGKPAKRTFYYGRQPEIKTPEEENRERFMNGKYFQIPTAGTPTDALSLRQWQVQMNMYQRLLLEHDLKAGKKKKKVVKKKTGVKY